MKSVYKINLTLIVIFLLCLALVLVTGINKVLFMNINSLASYFYPFIWANLTFLGDTLPACAFMLLFIRKRPDLVWSGIIATIFATLIVNILKLCLDVPRPPAIIDKGLINIIGPAIYYHSFPSGHTVTIFTLTGILIFNFQSFFVRFGLILLALVIGISRIAVGVHWPADVLGGAALGILCATLGVYSVTRLRWNIIKSLQLIIGFVLIFLNFYLLFFYDCKYKQAIYLQICFAIAVLIAGTREYYLLLKNH
jgi:membrane-associated phospholipid phosphatase